MKCLLCGSNNVKVDFEKLLTSFPPAYECRCQDCGHIGYMSASEIYDMENNETPKEKPNGGMMGWICPKCGRCYSPYATMCTFCNNDMTWEITY